ncbi:hypothetical protein RFI_13385 [Reticulomyxa filosa]|uniref:Uncharacterized protein n=1 Tax=Reticulomyxa filosa TaxID=46433 RepID=X6NBW8_RETFI|nr:hypothetical protein RFI_13385 [Reticulomyxa filosa]|eukprot:ETO23790.1 hypothetical protein RFI_13385 [Reticulomyxa filosa]
MEVVYQKHECHHELINFRKLSMDSLKELTYKDVVNEIKARFGAKFAGIMDDNCTVNVKWKLVSFKEAHVILADNSKDIQILDDSSLQEDNRHLNSKQTNKQKKKSKEFTNPSETKVDWSGDGTTSVLLEDDE